MCSRAARAAGAAWRHVAVGKVFGHGGVSGRHHPGVGRDGRGCTRNRCSWSHTRHQFQPRVPPPRPPLPPAPSGPSSVWPSPSVAGYVHRIGRCGRAGRVGIAVTLLVDTDRRLAPELVTLLRRSGQPVPPELTDWARRAPAQGPVELDDDAAAEAEARAENRERQLERERQKRQGGRRKGGRVLKRTSSGEPRLAFPAPDASQRPTPARMLRDLVGAADAAARARAFSCHSTGHPPLGTPARRGRAHAAAVARGVANRTLPRLHPGARRARTRPHPARTEPSNVRP